MYHWIHNSQLHSKTLLACMFLTIHRMIPNSKSDSKLKLKPKKFSPQENLDGERNADMLMVGSWSCLLSALKHVLLFTLRTRPCACVFHTGVVKYRSEILSHWAARMDEWTSCDPEKKIQKTRNSISCLCPSGTCIPRAHLAIKYSRNTQTWQCWHFVLFTFSNRVGRYSCRSHQL